LRLARVISYRGLVHSSHFDGTVCISCSGISHWL